MSSQNRTDLGSGAEPRSLLEIARGSVRAHQSFRLVGLNRNVNGVETVWPLGALYSFPTLVQTLRVRAGNAADDATGSGAREILVRGLDGSFDPISESITLAGTSASSATSLSFARVNQVIVTQAGSYGGTNVGNVFVDGTTSGVFGGIEAGAGISRVAVGTVPAGWTAYITGGSIGSSGPAAVELWERRRADAGSAPFGPARNLMRRRVDAGTWPANVTSYVEVPEKTDLWFTADTSSATEVSVDLEMILVNSDAVNPE